MPKLNFMGVVHKLSWVTLELLKYDDAVRNFNKLGTIRITHTR